MNNENLIGTLALVHPEVKHDPAKKQGQVGVITYVSKDNSEIYMSFPGRGEGKYVPDDVLKLKDQNQVLDALVNRGESIPIDDFKALYKVTMLQARNTSTGTLSALEIARDSPAIWDKTLEPAIAGEKLQLEKALAR